MKINVSLPEEDVALLDEHAAYPLRDERGRLPEIRPIEVAPRVPGDHGRGSASGIGAAPANILELQGLSGNRSVQRLLAARQIAPAATGTAPATTPGAPLLSTAQEARAP